MNVTIPSDDAFDAHRAASADDVDAIAEMFSKGGSNALSTPLPDNSYTPLSIALLRQSRRAALFLVAVAQVDLTAQFNVVKTSPRGSIHIVCTELQLACWLADAEIVGAMLRVEPDRTQLAHFAAHNTDAAVIRLLGRSMSVDSLAGMDERPSHIAARNKNEAVLRFLLEAGCNVHAVDSAGGSLAHSAASNENAQLLAMVLAAGVDPNARNLHGQTPCHVAAANRNADVLALLLAVDGIDLNVIDSIGRTPCDVACANDNSAVLTKLLRRGGTFGALHVSCFGALAHFDTLQVIVELDQFDIESRNDNGATMLLHAAQTSTAAVVALLLAAGADKHAKSQRHGWSVCHHAVMNKFDAKFNVLRTLNAAGADARALDNESQSPLHLACMLDHVLALDALGVDVVEAARTDARVVRCAMRGPCGLVLQRLIRARIDFSSVRCCQGSERAVALLFAAGKNVDVPEQLSKDAILALPLPTLIACGADVGSQVLAHLDDLPWSAGRLLIVAGLVTTTAHLRLEIVSKQLAKRQFELMLLRGFEIAVGLQPLELSALVLTEILAHMFAPLESLVPFHRVWNIATTVKHFSSS